MPDSHNRRPACSVKKSPSSRIKNLLKRTEDLEQQLATLSKSNDEKAARLRSHLCEVLSDILISDPVVGMENDCTGRLWRSCFYAPIGIWRSRISREKRKQGSNLSSLEQAFKKFLGEAITLYDYLVLQYQSKLAPSDSQISSQGSTQESFPSAVSEEVEGVIPGLHRLYIHMGDLNRYSESYSKAENCYLSAAKLAPGMGNPYNQLAVVAQIKDANMSCVALYWYARSLFATHGSFETSSSNLERLFNMNRKYLEEHAREPNPPVLSQWNKKAHSDMLRAQKAAASKSFLAHFVDFHYNFFKTVEAEGTPEPLFREKMTAIMRSFHSLLQASAFGDSLLCKIVVISTFSLEMNKESNKLENYRLSCDFLFSLGSSLSERLMYGLTKVIDKTGKVPPSIRLLMPFEILCEYIEHYDIRASSNEQEKFWKRVVDVANLISRLSERLDVPFPSSPADQTSPFPLKEYQLLKGYRPYRFLDKEYLSDTPFVGPLEAVDALDLTPSQSQVSMTNSDFDENKIKLSRFLEFCLRTSLKHDIPLSRNECAFVYVDKGEDIDHVIQTYDVKNDALNPNSVEPAADANIPCEKADEAGDIVLLQAAEGQDEPTSHIPCSKVTSDVATTTKNIAECIQNDPTVSHIQPENVPNPISYMLPKEQNVPSFNASVVKPVAPPPGLTPPPGFGLPFAESKETAGVHSLQSVHFDQHLPGAQPHMAAVSSTPFLNPSSSHFTHQNLLDGNSPVPVVDQSLHWLGGGKALKTANPFAGLPVDVGLPPPSKTIQKPNEYTVDDASLLGLGLLDSLWMNDGTTQKTKNPFATNW